jgi:hypothetical protein
VAEAVRELGVLIVGNLEDAVLHPERVGVIFAERVTRDLHDPAIEVFPIEQLNPLLAVRVTLGEHGGCGNH